MVQKISPKNRRILIRCDASSEVGFGHVTRCLALADELRNIYGCSVSFAMRTAEIGFQCVRENGYTVMSPTDKQNFDYQKWIENVAYDSKADTLILDIRDDLPRDVLRNLKNDKILIVTIDDPSDRRLDADMAFYPPVPQVRHMNWESFGGELYCGWEWVILRKEFTAIWKRTKNAKPVILVAMGGSDPQGITLKVIRSLDMLRENFESIIILGQGFQHQKELSELLAKTRRTFILRQNIKNMAQLMAGADFAVASFGVTAYELAAIGVPAILLCLTEDHSKSASAFVDAGIALNLGVHDHVSENRLSILISKYLSNDSLLSKIVKNNEKLPKQHGANHIAGLIFRKGLMN